MTKTRAIRHPALHAARDPRSASPALRPLFDRLHALRMFVGRPPFSARRHGHGGAGRPSDGSAAASLEVAGRKRCNAVTSNRRWLCIQAPADRPPTRSSWAMSLAAALPSATPAPADPRRHRPEGALAHRRALIKASWTSRPCGAHRTIRPPTIDRSATFPPTTAVPRPSGAADVARRSPRRSRRIALRRSIQAQSACRLRP